MIQSLPQSPSGLPGDLTLDLEWSQLGGLAVKAAIVLALAWIAYRGIAALTRRFERSVQTGSGFLDSREQRSRTLAQLARNVAAVTLVVVTTLVLIGIFIPRAIAPLLASVGILGLALSFGAQSLVKDLISGFFMLAESQYQVGDVIRVNEATTGQVEKVTMRVVVLRDIHGTVHTFPHGEVRQVSNLTKEWSRVVLDVGVAYREDPDRVIEVLRAVGRELWEDDEWRPLLVEEPVVPGVQALAESAVQVRFTAKTRPLRQWEVGRELNRRIKKRFDAEGIEIPFPHRTLYWGEDQPRPDWMGGSRRGAEGSGAVTGPGGEPDERE